MRSSTNTTPSRWRREGEVGGTLRVGTCGRKARTAWGMRCRGPFRGNSRPANTIAGGRIGHRRVELAAGRLCVLMEVEMLSAVAASSTLSFARTPAGAGVQVLAAVHAYTTAVLVSGSIFVVGAVLTGVLLFS